MSIGRKHPQYPMIMRVACKSILALLCLCTSCSSPQKWNIQPSPGFLGPITILPVTLAQPPQLDNRQQRQLSLFSASLNNPGEIEASIRIIAAEELILMQADQATEVLALALGADRLEVTRAIIEAMDRQTRPVQGLLDPAVGTLVTAPPEIIDRLAVILTRYEPDALPKIAALALNIETPVEQRLGPIRALAAFRSRDSAARLIELLEQPVGEDDRIRVAACQSLTTLSGSRHGTNVQSWMRWWRQVKNLPAAKWLEVEVATLQSQNAALVEENTGLRNQLDLANTRMIRAFGDIVPLLDVQDQLNLLFSNLLIDENPLVREFAIDRLEFITRDIATVSLDLQEKLADRMGDSEPVIRHKAAELLDSFGYAGIADRVALALVDEADREGIKIYLTILVARVSTNALEPLCRWLSDDEFNVLASDALWTMMISEHGTDERIAFTRNVLRQTMSEQASPSMVQLMAFVGEEPDRMPLESLLDNDDESLQRAVAQGFVQGNYTQPLLDRANDPNMYPFALEVLENNADSLSQFQQIALLQPTPEHGALWNDTVARVAAKLAPSEILQIDDILNQLEYATLEMRSTILGRIATLPPDQLSVTQHQGVVERWAPLLIERDEWQRAFEVLETLPEIAPDSPMVDVKFEAALLIGRYDVAYLLNDKPGPWIGILSDIALHHQDAAIRLRDEISTRFNGLLVDEVKTAFDSASGRIPQIDSTPDQGNQAEGLGGLQN